MLANECRGRCYQKDDASRVCVIDAVRGYILSKVPNKDAYRCAGYVRIARWQRVVVVVQPREDDGETPIGSAASCSVAAERELREIDDETEKNERITRDR